jgi:hypothetical protein
VKTQHPGPSSPAIRSPNAIRQNVLNTVARLKSATPILDAAVVIAQHSDIAAFPA